MANERDHYSRVASTTAAVAGIAAWLEARKMAEAHPPGELVIPEELMTAIAAIAATSEHILQELQQLILDPHLTVKGWPPNVKGIRTTAVTCIEPDKAYQPDTLLVPDGFTLIIKAHPFNAVQSLVRVATNQFECLSPEMSYPLLPNEAVTYQVKDAAEFWVSSTIAGSIVIFSTGQEV